MPVSAEHQVVLALQSALEEITVANGYETEVHEVILYDKPLDDIPVSPSIMIATLGTTEDQTRFANKNEVSLRVLMRLSIEEYTQEHDDVGNFVSDVKKRIFSEGSIFLAGTCRLISFVSTERFHEDEYNPHAGADVVLSILFRHSLADPFTPTP